MRWRLVAAPTAGEVAGTPKSILISILDAAKVVDALAINASTRLFSPESDHDPNASTAQRVMNEDGAV